MLFEKYKLSGLKLKNRMVMPPLTRARAAGGEVPTELMAKYYAQRASAGLIISEGTQISRQGQGYAGTPGIYTAEQVEGWKRVTDAVHREGGVMFAQLWHVGRISHVSLQEDGAQPVAPSAISAPGVKVFINGKNGGEMVQHSEPRELSLSEIKSIIRDYAAAAANAVKAGFDGVELHGANGYLIEQFIDSETNLRNDIYGGSLENRLRFLKEVVIAVGEEIGFDRVGVRQAPLTTLMGAQDANPELTYIEAAKMLNELGIAYIHVAEADWDDAPVMSMEFKRKYRQAFSGTLIYAGKYTKDRAIEAIENGLADLIAFGRPFIANPDLPFRFERGTKLNQPRPEFFFGGAEEGYTDYPEFA